MRGRAVMGGFSASTVPHDVVTLVFDEGHSPLRAWRKYLKLSQAEVAKRMGISANELAKVEGAKRPKSTTLSLAAMALGINKECLVF